MTSFQVETAIINVNLLIVQKKAYYKFPLSDGINSSINYIYSFHNNQLNSRHAKQSWYSLCGNWNDRATILSLFLDVFDARDDIRNKVIDLFRRTPPKMDDDVETCIKQYLSLNLEDVLLFQAAYYIIQLVPIIPSNDILSFISTVSDTKRQELLLRLFKSEKTKNEINQCLHTLPLCIIGIITDYDIATVDEMLYRLRNDIDYQSLII